jgi:hypothetical protein
LSKIWIRSPINPSLEKAKIDENHGKKCGKDCTDFNYDISAQAGTLIKISIQRRLLFDMNGRIPQLNTQLSMFNVHFFFFWGKIPYRFWGSVAAFRPAQRGLK